MRTLADALASISEHSAAIHSAAQHNAAPAGRYTTAFLDSIHANPDPAHAKLRAARRRAGAPENNGVLDLIRDALPAEDRLFKYVGESDGGAKKTYQEREGVVTPLREQRVKERKQGGEDAEVLLETAIRLVDDYHDMPRARARIYELREINNAQLERIFELEVTIEDASGRASSSSAPTPSAPTPAKAKAARTRKIPENADEALLLEEQALRALEKRLAPIRAARPLPAQVDAADAPPPSRGGLANSPPIRAGQSSSRANIASTPTKSPVKNPLARSSRTPSASLAQSRPAKTPSKTPQTSTVNITNALVSQTPRTARPTIDRFSPLRLLGTPRAYRPDASRSGLRESYVPQAEDGEKRAGLSLFSSRLGRGVLGASTSRIAAGGNAGEERVFEAEDAGVFGAPGSGIATTAEHDTIPSTGADAQLDMSDTVRMPLLEPTGDQDVGDETVRLDAGSAQDGHDLPSDDAPTIAAGKAEAPGMSNGVFVDHPMMAAAAGKIIGTRLAEIRQGLAPSEVLNTDMRSLVDHLTRLLRSDPDPPPSPSSASSSSHLSATTPEKAMPITQQGILAAQILLTLLRLLPANTPAGETPELGMSMAELKEVVADLIQARGWEQEQSVALDRGTKFVYWIMTKKVVRIDRSQCKGAGGKVILAI